MSRYKSGGTRIESKCGVRCKSASLSVTSTPRKSVMSSLLKIDFLNVKTFCANVDFCEIMQTGSRAMPYLLTPSEHRVRAMALRARGPNSRAAQLHDLAANMKDRQARLAANRAALAANKPRRVGLDWRVVFGVLAIASSPWLG
jgi:hypothetical protein